VTGSYNSPLIKNNSANYVTNFPRYTKLNQRWPALECGVVWTLAVW